MEKTIERSTSKLVKRSSLLTIAFISVQLFIPAFAVPIAPPTNGFIYDIGATTTIAPGVGVSNINVPYYNPYITQICGNSCTYNDYKNALLTAPTSSYDLTIPKPLLASNNLKPTSTPVQYVFNTNYNSTVLAQSFKNASNQPITGTESYLFSADPTIVNPTSIVLGNTALANCQPLKPCLMWGMSWNVSDTAPADFTPGTMQPSAIALVQPLNGNPYHIQANGPFTFANTTFINSASARVNGWHYKFGNFGNSITLEGTSIDVSTAVALVGVGATYVSSTTNERKWAFFYNMPNITDPKTYVRLKKIDSYCDENNNCQDVVNITNEKEVNEGDTVFNINNNNTAGGDKTLVSQEVIPQVKDPVTNTWTDKPSVIKVQIPSLQGLPTQTQTCIFGDSKCIIQLNKATDNGFVQCTVGNTNVDCSEWVAGVNITNPQIVNTYQCRINGVNQSLDKCQQLEGKYNAPVPQYADPEAQGTPLTCSPPGFQILNPFVFVQSTTCVLQYLFIPTKGLSYYYNAYKINIESTILAFPNNFFNDFTDPILNNDFTYNEANCMGLQFTVPVNDVLQGTLFQNAVDENLELYPFQACSDEAKLLSTKAREIEGMLIYLAAGFISARVITGALGLNLPFLNNRGRKDRIGL